MEFEQNIEKNYTPPNAELLETKEQVSEYALYLLNSRLNNLGISLPNPYKLSNLYFSKFSAFGNGRYNVENDIIAINPAYWFDLGLLTHELTHATASSWRREATEPSNKYCGFYGYFLLNEGTTELIAQDLTSKCNIKIGEISVLEKSEIVTIMRKKTADKVRKIRRSLQSEMRSGKKSRFQSKIVLAIHRIDEERLRSSDKSNPSGYEAEVQIVQIVLGKLAQNYSEIHFVDNETAYREVWDDWQRDYFNSNIGNMKQKIRSVFNDDIAIKLESFGIADKEELTPNFLLGAGF